MKDWKYLWHVSAIFCAMWVVMEDDDEYMISSAFVWTRWLTRGLLFAGWKSLAWAISEWWVHRYKRAQAESNLLDQGQFGSSKLTDCIAKKFLNLA